MLHIVRCSVVNFVWFFSLTIRGHVLLVGPEGCGKRSTTRLAAFTAGLIKYELFFSSPQNCRTLHKCSRFQYTMWVCANPRDMRSRVMHYR